MWGVGCGVWGGSAESRDTSWPHSVEGKGPGLSVKKAAPAGVTERLRGG